MTDQAPGEFTEESATIEHQNVVENIREILLKLEERLDIATLYTKFLKLSDDVSKEMKILLKALTSPRTSIRRPEELDHMESQRQNIQQLFLQTCNLSKNCMAMLDEKADAQIDIIAAKNNITNVMDRLNAQQSDLIQAWSADKSREKSRQSKVLELQAKANQLAEELSQFQFMPFLHLSEEPSFMVSSLEHSYSQITRLREIVKQLEDWRKISSDEEVNLSPSVKDQVAKGQVCYFLVSCSKVPNKITVGLH